MSRKWAFDALTLRQCQGISRGVLTKHWRLVSLRQPPRINISVESPSLQIDYEQATCVIMLVVVANC